MGLVNVDTKGAVDEAAKVLPAALDQVLSAAIDKLITDLKGLLVGREITITIK